MTSVYTVEWVRERRAVSETYVKRSVAIECARNLVSEQTPVVTIWQYVAREAPAINCLAFAHDGREWWDERKLCRIVRHSKKSAEA